jgi:phosphoglycolate phosphatase
MQLRSRGIPTAVVTSLPARIADPLLECVKAGDFFIEVVNASNCPSRKPSPGPLIFALDRIGVVPDRDVFYVGDQPGDAAAADAAGITFAWASYGYGRERPGNTAAALKSFSEVLLL